MYASMPGDNPLFAWLDEVISIVRDGWKPTSKVIEVEVDGPFGRHGIVYGKDDEGEYATIGFTLPDDIYAEIEGETYAQLQGFRIYKDAD